MHLDDDSIMNRTLLHALLGSFFAAGIIGCGRDVGRPVHIVVTVDGVPLGDGNLTLHPLTGTPGPSAGSHVRGGQAELPASAGVQPGSFRVEITAIRKLDTPPVYDELTNQSLPTYEQYLPARYNSDSGLTLEVKHAGENHFVFALDSEKPAVSAQR